MVQTSFQLPVIEPLVTRHAEDAAFYWSQLDRAATSPQIGFERLVHFTKLHDAHLAGLATAGSAGWQPALSALERWQKAIAIGFETGCLGFLFVEEGDADMRDDVWEAKMVAVKLDLPIEKRVYVRRADTLSDASMFSAWAPSQTEFIAA